MDILINNAGLVQGKFFHELDERMALKTMAVNFESNMWTVREFLPDMLKVNEGHIVAICSLAGLVGQGGMTDYSASKFAQYGFHEGLRIEMKILKKNIPVTTICPWIINTGMFSGCQTPLLAGLLEQEDVVNRIVTAIL